MKAPQAKTLAIVIFILLSLAGFALVKHQLDRLNQQVFILGCQDSGKVSLEACRAALQARGNT